MPRKVNPGSIKVGKGLAPEGTVEDNSFRYPERDVDPLRVHIHDPSRAHMASSIGIVDANDCYVSDEVEGALQELCGHTGAGRLNGLISGGTFSELVNPNGTGPVALAPISFTLTLVNPTEVLMNGTVFDASGLTVELPAAADTYYIYLSTDPTAPTYRALVASTAPPPEVETAAGVEDILFAKIVHDGTDINSWQDGRFFVRNLDRKVTYSSRQGENVDAWSEGCFATLEAFFLWMEEYGDGGTNEEEKGTVLIRGTHTLNSTLTVPTDHIQFEGDGEAILLGGNAAINFVDVTGRTDITFRGITFSAIVAGCKGIVATDGCESVRVEGCTFSGTTQFERCLDLVGGPATPVLSVWVRDSTMVFNEMGVSVTGGLGSLSAFALRMDASAVKGPGAGIGSSVGIQIGDGSNAAGDVIVSQCRVEDAETGIVCRQAPKTRIQSCSIIDVKTAFNSLSGALEDFSITENTIVLDDTHGEFGIRVDDARRGVISHNNIAQLRTGFNVTNSRGILVGSATPVALEENVVVSGNVVRGFWDTVTSSGEGIYLSGTDTFPVINTTVTGNILHGCSIGGSFVKNSTIIGNTVTAEGGLTTALIGVDACENIIITDNALEGSAEGTQGVQVRSTAAVLTEVTVSQNSVRGMTTAGIHIESNAFNASNLVVSDNTVDCFLDVNTPPTARGIFVEGGGVSSIERVTISGNTVTRCYDGILAVGQNSTNLLVAISITGNKVSFCAHGQDNRVDTFDSAGSMGIGFTFCEAVLVEGNIIEKVGEVVNNGGTPITIPNLIYPLGIYGREVDDAVVRDNLLRNFESQGAGEVAGIVFDAKNSVSDNLAVSGNTITLADTNTRDRYGIGFFGSSDTDVVGFRRVQVLDNQIEGLVPTPHVTWSVVVSDGDWLTGYSNFYGMNLFQIEIRGNQISGFAKAGVGVDCGATASLVRGRTFTEIDICGNFLVAKNRTQYQNPIYLFAGATDIHTALVQGIRVRNNVISRAYDTGISIALAVDGVAGVKFPKMVDIEVTGNRVSNLVHDALSAGYIFENNANDPGDIDDYRNITFSDNVLEYVDATDIPDYGMYLDFGKFTLLTNVEVSRNRLTATAGTNGIVRIETDNTGVGDPAAVIEYLQVKDNLIKRKARGGGVIGAITPGVLAFDMEGASLNRFEVSNNMLVGAGTGPVRSCTFNLTNPTTTAQLFAEGLISNNTFYGNVLFEGSGKSVNNIQFIGNKVYGSKTSGSAAATDEALLWDFTIGSINPTDAFCHNVCIDNNLFYGGARGVSYELNQFNHETISIRNNEFRSQSGSSTVINRAIRMASNGGTTGYDLIDISIDGNIIGEPSFSSGIVFKPDVNGGTFNLRGLSISGNKMTGDMGVGSLTGPVPAILCDLREVTPAGTSEITNIMIDDNSIMPDADGERPQEGIWFGSPDDDQAQRIDNLSISGNTTYVFAPGDGTATAITAYLRNPDPTPMIVENLKMDGNVVDVAADPALAPTSANGIWVEATCELRTASLSSNLITGVARWPLSNGLKLFHSFSTTEAVEVDPSAGSFETWAVGIETTSTDNMMVKKVGINDPVDFRLVTWRQVSVDRNTITFNSGEVSLPVFGGARYGALYVAHVLQYAAPDRKVIIGLWGFSMVGNVVSSNKFNGTVPADTRGQDLVGVYLSGSPAITGQWSNAPTYTPVAGSFSQEAWTITSNVSRDARRFDDTPNVSHGTCVYVEDTTVAIPGALVGNYAQDDDPVATSNGWTELNIVTATGNINADARFYV